MPVLTQHEPEKRRRRVPVGVLIAAILLPLITLPLAPLAFPVSFNWPPGDSWKGPVVFAFTTTDIAETQVVQSLCPRHGLNWRLENKVVAIRTGDRICGIAW